MYFYIVPIIDRRCAVGEQFFDPDRDGKLWNMRPSSASLMCHDWSETITGITVVNRRCLCKGANCNNQNWEKIVTSPVMPVGRNAELRDASIVSNFIRVCSVRQLGLPYRHWLSKGQPKALKSKTTCLKTEIYWHSQQRRIYEFWWVTFGPQKGHENEERLAFIWRWG